MGIVFNIIVILLTLGVAYLWATRGLFSAFLHLACTLVAGAIAFAAWEPLAYFMLDTLPTSGFFRFLHGMSWSIALLVPFAVSLIVLRVIVDRAVPNNTKQAPAVDLVGGGVCGLGAAVIAMGFVVLGVSYTRLSIGLTGYKPLWYSDQRQEHGGSLIRTGALWLPADRITAGVYSTLSGTTLATGERLLSLCRVPRADRGRPSAALRRRALRAQSRCPRHRRPRYNRRRSARRCRRPGCSRRSAVGVVSPRRRTAPGAGRACPTRTATPGS